MLNDRQIIKKQLLRVFGLYSAIILGLIGLYGGFVMLAYPQLKEFYIWFGLGVYIFMLLVGWFTYKYILLRNNPNLHEDLVKTYKLKKGIK